MESCKIEMPETPGGEDIAALGAGLHAFNMERVGYSDFKGLTLLLRDADGAVCGGLVGNSYWNWLYVDTLWVAEASRGEGYGAKLLGEAEAEAIRRGCKNVYLDTFDFQAPEFYKNQGYKVFGELPDFADGHTRYFLTKRLEPSE